MSQDIYMESRHLGYAIIWGLELAVCYDALLILRNVVKHKNIFVYMEDFVYWMFCALFVFEHLYEIGNGHIRWYMALGIGIGMLAYKLIVSRWVVKVVSNFLKKVLGIIGKILSITLAPIRFLWKKIKGLFRFLKCRMGCILRLLKKKLTLAVKMLKITLCKR